MSKKSILKNDLIDKFKIISINSTVFLLGLLFFEFLSGQILKRYLSDSLNYINDRTNPHWKFSHHPSVGHAHSNQDFLNSINIKNAKSYNNLYVVKEYLINAKDELKLNILSLGGSTTDPLGNIYTGLNGTWPELTAEDLKVRLKRNIRLINAGVAGGTSSNELMRLLTILNMEKIDLVISLNGLNEIDLSEKQFKNKEYIYASKWGIRAFANDEFHFDDKIFTSKINNNIKWKIRDKLYKLNLYKLSYILRNKTYSKLKNKKFTPKEVLQKENLRRDLDFAADIWLRNIKSMHAISKSNGSIYFTFLQPHYLLDKNSESLPKQINEFQKLNPEEKHLILKYGVPSSAQIYRFNYLYSLLREKCSKVSYCYDLSQDSYLNSNQDLYHDLGHLNRKGNEILYKKILSVVEDNIDSFIE